MTQESDPAEIIRAAARMKEEKKYPYFPPSFTDHPLPRRGDRDQAKDLAFHLVLFIGVQQ